MRITELGIAGAWIIDPQRHGDDRGWFQEWFKQSELESECGFHFAPVQANISKSARGTIRGVHYSSAEIGQAKLVTVLSGAIDDYVIDVRPSSPTFGKWERVFLSAENGRSVLLSSFLGHAFHALADDTVVNYLVSAEYNPVKELGVSPFCPHLAIEWADTGGYSVAPKDNAAPDLLSQRDAGLLPKNQ
jgi:dTDP-4-dehydrorhamnose 3,5-epimerase